MSILRADNSTIAGALTEDEIEDTIAHTIESVMDAAAAGNLQLLERLLHLIEVFNSDESMNLKEMLTARAVVNGRLKTVRWLVDVKGVNVCLLTHDDAYATKYEFGREVPLIAYAAKKGHWNIVRWMVEDKDTDINIMSAPEVLSMHLIVYAAYQEQWDVVRWLADERGADINVQDEYGTEMAAVVYMVRLAPLEVIKWLIEEKGVDANISVWDGYEGQFPLLSYSAGREAWDIVQWLIEEKKVKVDIEVKKPYEEWNLVSLIEYIVLKGQTDILKLLIDSGRVDANVSICEEDACYAGIPLIAYAGKKGQWKIAKWLASAKGADVNANVVDETIFGGQIDVPLIICASKQGQWDVVRWLVDEMGAELKISASAKYSRVVDGDAEEENLVRHAVLSERLDILEWLLKDKNIDMSIVSAEAVRYRNLQIQQWLSDQKGHAMHQGSILPEGALDLGNRQDVDDTNVLVNIASRSDITGEIQQMSE